MTVGEDLRSVPFHRHRGRLGLIDEDEFVVLPRLAGHGPRLLYRLMGMIDLKLVERSHFASGAVVLRYEAKGRSGRSRAVPFH